MTKVKKKEVINYMKSDFFFFWGSFQIMFQNNIKNNSEREKNRKFLINNDAKDTCQMKGAEKI